MGEAAAHSDGYGQCSKCREEGHFAAVSPALLRYTGRNTVQVKGAGGADRVPLQSPRRSPPQYKLPPAPGHIVTISSLCTVLGALELLPKSSGGGRERAAPGSQCWQEGGQKTGLYGGQIQGTPLVCPDLRFQPPALPPLTNPGRTSHQTFAGDPLPLLESWTLVTSLSGPQSPRGNRMSPPYMLAVST